VELGSAMDKGLRMGAFTVVDGSVSKTIKSP
jgi:hypothetical protein